MKFRISTLLTVIAMLIMTISVNAQKAEKPTCIVLNVDAEGISMDSKQMGNLVRMELDKLQKYEVVDRYDVAYLIEKNDLKIDNCFGKICLLEIGNQLEVQYMFTGSVERFGEVIIMTMRLINVDKGIIEKTQVMEFQNYPKEIQSMTTMCIAKLFGDEVNTQLERYLTKKNDFENTINNPNVDQLNLSGPRMGLTFLTGDAATIMSDSKENGGYDAYPFFTSFGYQFEVQYLNEGNFQALFEFLPLISGLDQGRIVPSMTVLHGLRNNKNGLEFAFGPTISMFEAAKGYYQEDGSWILQEDWNQQNQNVEPPSILETRMDSRGNLIQLSPGFVFALGWTFKSGKLNIPVNAFVVPNKSNTRIGISMGFNGKR